MTPTFLEYSLAPTFEVEENRFCARDEKDRAKKEEITFARFRKWSACALLVNSLGG